MTEDTAVNADVWFAAHSGLWCWQVYVDGRPNDRNGYAWTRCGARWRARRAVRKQRRQTA